MAVVGYFIIVKSWFVHWFVRGLVFLILVLERAMVNAVELVIAAESLLVVNIFI
jgi:hypothetical protein